MITLNLTIPELCLIFLGIAILFGFLIREFFKLRKRVYILDRLETELDLTFTECKEGVAIVSGVSNAVVLTESEFKSFVRELKGKVWTD